MIAFYDAKYAYRLWRPVTAIRAADTDGNPGTTADPAWTPLSATAPDPSYPGAHATISAAGARVLAAFFGDRGRLRRHVADAARRRALVHELRRPRRRRRASAASTTATTRASTRPRARTSAATSPRGSCGAATTGTCCEPPPRRPRPDGDVAGVPPRLRRLRRRPAGDDAGRRGAAPADRRRGLARPGPSLVQGVRRPLRRRRGLGHDHLVRARAALAAFDEVAGGIIGLPFSLEGFAFFIEAIFLGIYLYGWDRLSPRAHWLAGWPVAARGRSRRRSSSSPRTRG